MSLRDLFADLRLAARSLRRRPAFALAAILTLGLGIGATGAVYTVIHAVLLSELPFPEPDRLVAVSAERRLDGVEEFPVSYLDFGDWREQVGDQVGAMSARTAGRSFYLEVGGGDEVVRHEGEMVESSYLPLLGIEPTMGRWFSAEEDTPPGEPVVVLGHDLWRERFGGDPGAVGQPLRLNGRPFTVIGVAPRGFRGVTDQAGSSCPWPSPAPSRPPSTWRSGAPAGSTASPASATG